MKSLKNKTENFWKTFLTKEKDIREMVETNTLAANFSEIENILEIDMPFMLGKNEQENKYELIFNPSGLRSRYFISDYFKRKMPIEIKENWIFYDTKPPIGGGNMELHIYDMTFGADDINIIIDDINLEKNKINFSVVCPKFFGENRKPSDKKRMSLDTIRSKIFKGAKKELTEDEKYNILFNLLDGIIGEAYVEFYLGNIDIIKNTNKTELYSLIDFKNKINQIIEENSWNKKPRFIDNYTIYRNNEDIQQQGAIREDIFIGTSTNFRLITEYNSKDNLEYKFMHEQGCVYGMLFYDNTNIPNEKKLDVRNNLENYLADLPEYGEIFEIIGFASGKYYSYLDVIVYDIDNFHKLLGELSFNSELVDLSYKDFLISAPIRKILDEDMRIS